jgi:hypothetical protein
MSVNSNSNSFFQKNMALSVNAPATLSNLQYITEGYRNDFSLRAYATSLLVQCHLPAHSSIASGERCESVAEKRSKQRTTAYTRLLAHAKDA